MASATSSSKAKPSSSAKSSRIGRGTRWTEDQVKLLLDTVASSKTAKEAFESVASQLGKSTGTVQQKYYALQRKVDGGRKAAGRRGRPRGSATKRTAEPASRVTGSLLTASQLRSVSTDELVGLAQRVRDEVDRRKRELDAASKLFG